MAGPTNVSLKGIIDWSQQGNGGDGHPLENDINADRVDGKHYSDLKSEWETFAQSAGGGGVVAFGDSTFVGNGSYRTITFSPDLGAINYVVGVMPMADTNSYVGEIWWSRVSGTQFRVYNEGSGTTAFRWSVMVQGQMPDLAGAASGDIAGNYPGPITVDGLQGRAVSSSAPSTGQVLTWNGSSWAPATPTLGSAATGYLIKCLNIPSSSFSTLPVGSWSRAIIYVSGLLSSDAAVITQLETTTGTSPATTSLAYAVCITNYLYIYQYFGTASSHNMSALVFRP